MIMKKLIMFALLFVSIVVNAQKDVTKFLGIPVDGAKSTMIQKLKAKGFRYNINRDVLTGEFNGKTVKVSVVTYRDKVWRIVVEDINYVGEADIKINFNNLCKQFNKNEKYSKASLTSDFIIPDDEDISYNMSVENKRYQATYWQKPENMSDAANDMASSLKSKYTEEELKELTEEQRTELISEMIGKVVDTLSKKSVWFMINEEYGKYGIVLYYDNEYNHITDDDL